MAAAPVPDQFDAYFRAADLNQDGKISGQEAVSFFKGSNLPQPVLAQIWTYADQNRTGFLGRPEFYNYLRLVTVAQAGRQLTPDIVKSALFGPAASKIPAPKINMPVPATSPVPSNQVQQTVPTPLSGMQMPAHQNAGFRPVQQPVPRPMGPAQVQQPVPRPMGPGPVQQPVPRPMGPGPVQQPVPRPMGPGPVQQPVPRPMGPGPSPLSQRPPVPVPVQNHQVGNTPNLSTDWFSGKRNLPPAGGTPPVQQPVQQAGPTPQATNRSLSGLTAGEPANGLTGNGFTSSSPQTAPVDPFASFAPITKSTPSPSVAPSTGPVQLPQQNHSPQQNQFMQNKLTQNQLPPKQVTAPQVSTVPVQAVQSPWPKITQSDIQKYTVVFIKVDRDRDGKITGEEARNLFLSWKLHREVLKKVWELSDQDKDGMLSFREFCTAVYLMERHREHRPLPDQLPPGIWSEGISFPSTGQFSASNAVPTPQPVSGYGQQGRSGMMMPPQQRGPREIDGPRPQEPPKSKVPVLEKHLLDQLSKEEIGSLTSKFQEASDADKKVQELEKEIMESKEKIEFYRTKMQELILYKSRCDNRLNEISERVSADKREVVGFSKIYEDKCKQLGDVASRLTLEEATFRDIQEKKMEIYDTILKFKKGDQNDDAAQERANKIQTELEELSKQLNDQCKNYGLRAKPTTVRELPFGWQPGILQTAEEWDEEWDKFGDDGFEIIKELTIEIEKPKKDASKPEIKTENKESSDATAKKEESPDSSTQEKDEKTEKNPPVVDQSTEGDSVISKDTPDNAEKKTESPRSVPSSSPSKKSPKKANNNDVFDNKNESKSSLFNDVSPRASGNVSDHDGGESSISGDNKFTDEPSWGPSFDHSDDADSAWNFNSKEKDNSNFFFGGEKLGPIKTGSPNTVNKPFFDSVPSTPMSAVGNYNEPQKPFFDSVPSTPMSNFGTNYEPQKGSFFDSVPSTPMSAFGTNYNEPKSSFFDSSVPSTPMSIYGTNQEPQKAFFDSFSPRYSEAGDDNSFDNFSNNFDSFNDNNNNNNYFGSQKDTFSRFDSFRSTNDQGFGDSFSQFDSNNSTSDQFGAAEKTFSRFDSMNSNAGDALGDSRFSRFDSMNSTGDQFENKFGRFDSMRSTGDQFENKFGRFDSMRSTDDKGLSFDENDPYGPGPVKFNEIHSPRHGTDNWSNF